MQMDREKKILFAGLAVASAGAMLFALLAQAVMNGSTQEFDMKIRNVVHGWASPMLTRAMLGITQLGEPTIVILLGVLVVWRLWVAGRPRAAVLLAIAAAGAQACDQALKYSFARPRPSVFFGFAQPHTYSFPSGHSVESCCFYGVLAAILTAATPSYPRKAAIWIAASAITLAVGISRIYLGVHYPTDVLGGYTVAIIWAAVVHSGYLIWMRRRVRPSIS
jgi:undecaprenyl-diphosphatase